MVLIWAAPVDECLLKALNGESSPGTAGEEAAALVVGRCAQHPQAPEDHSLRHVTQDELTKLWAVGACRGSDGLPLLGPDGKLVCAIDQELLAKARERFEFLEKKHKEEKEARRKEKKKKLAEALKKQKAEEARKRAEEDLARAEEAREKSKRPLSTFAPPISERARLAEELRNQKKLHPGVPRTSLQHPEEAPPPLSPQTSVQHPEEEAPPLAPQTSLQRPEKAPPPRPDPAWNSVKGKLARVANMRRPADRRNAINGRLMQDVRLHQELEKDNADLHSRFGSAEEEAKKLYTQQQREEHFQGMMEKRQKQVARFMRPKEENLPAVKTLFGKKPKQEEDHQQHQHDGGVWLSGQQQNHHGYGIGWYSHDDGEEAPEKSREPIALHHEQHQTPKPEERAVPASRFTKTGESGIQGDSRNPLSFLNLFRQTIPPGHTLPRPDFLPHDDDAAEFHDIEDRPGP